MTYNRKFFVQIQKKKDLKIICIANLINLECQYNCKPDPFFSLHNTNMNIKIKGQDRYIHFTCYFYPVFCEQGRSRVVQRSSYIQWMTEHHHDKFGE